MNGRTDLANATLMELSPSDILIPARIGFLHEDKAAALGRLMAVDGQRDPIKVVRNLPSKPIADVVAEGKKPWRLVTGMHRLMGATYESISVFAIEVTGKLEDLADLEASENLHRRPLGPMEHAKFTAALVQAAQDRLHRARGGLKQQQLAANIRWQQVAAGEKRSEEALRDEVEDAESHFATAYNSEGESWENSVGSALGLGRDAIYRAMRLHRFIVLPFPDLAEALSKHPVVGENAKQLRAISDVKDEAKRRAVIEALLADNELSADEARVQVGIDLPDGPAPVAYQKHFNAIEGGWSRLGVAQKRDFLPTFVGLLTPDLKQRLRDLLENGGDDA